MTKNIKQMTIAELVDTIEIELIKAIEKIPEFKNTAPYAIILPTIEGIKLYRVHNLRVIHLPDIPKSDMILIPKEYYSQLIESKNIERLISELESQRKSFADVSKYRIQILA